MREAEESLTRSLVRLARRLAAHEAASGHPDQAIRWLKQALQFDEFDADLHQAILENYLKSDALKEARAYYRSLKEIYGRPADYPPGVRAMETRIYAASHADLPALPPDWNVRQSLQVPFIGQEELLAEMERAYRTGGGVLIYGEAGPAKPAWCRSSSAVNAGSPAHAGGLSAAGSRDAVRPVDSPAAELDWRFRMAAARLELGQRARAAPAGVEPRPERARRPARPPDVSAARCWRPSTACCC